MLSIPDPDFIVLLSRANTAAKALSAIRHCGESKWTAEVKIRLIHGVGMAEALRTHPPPIERFEVKVEIQSEMCFRRLTLEEAELIADTKC